VSARGRSGVRSPGLGRRGLLAALGGTAGCSVLGLGSETSDLPAWKKATSCRAGGCVTVDVHCHDFNGSDLPITGFITHIFPAPRAFTRPLAERLHRQINALSPSGREELADLLPAIASAAGPVRPPAPATTMRALKAGLAGLLDSESTALPPGTEQTLERLLEVFDLVARPRYEVAARLATLYETVDLFTPALVDYEYWSADAPETPLIDQIRVHGRLAELAAGGKLGRKEARFHPLVPFDPLREVRARIEADQAQRYVPFRDEREFSPNMVFDASKAPKVAALENEPGLGALDLVRIAVEGHGFVGVKVYPPVGFLPIGNDCWSFHRDSGLGAKLDRALHALYAYCQALDVPILTHGSPGNGYAVGYNDLASPVGWARVLRQYPGLRLDLGHLGHLTGVDHERGFSACESWMRQSAWVMANHPNVYADMANSRLVFDGEYGKRFVPVLQAMFARYPVTRDRVMYGSDFWLNHLDPGTAHSVDAFSETCDSQFTDVPGLREKVMGANALRFLGFGDAPANQNRTRLRAYYGRINAAAPSWLG
jgi:predicted TIM-barrel fold metal-dependent hydrolase